MPERYRPEGMTDAQRVFWEGMTDQRVANLWAAGDDWADLSPEAKEFLRKADGDKIKQLNLQMAFFSNSRVVWRFLWVGGGMLIAGFVGISQLLKVFGDWFTVKIK